MCDIHHSAKPGRDPMLYTAYRELCHSDANGRIQEEIWALHFGYGVRSRWPCEQQGQYEVLLATLCDNEVHDIRKSLGLPSGDVFADQKEAFDSRCRDLISIRLAGAPDMTAQGLLIAQAMMGSVRARATQTGLTSRTVHPERGLRQGKRLATDWFCC